MTLSYSFLLTLSQGAVFGDNGYPLSFSVKDCRETTVDPPTEEPWEEQGAASRTGSRYSRCREIVAFVRI